MENDEQLTISFGLTSFLDDTGANILKQSRSVINAKSITFPHSKENRSSSHTVL